MPALSLFDNCNFTLSHTTEYQKGILKGCFMQKGEF
jgi:hypothetical protein